MGMFKTLGYITGGAILGAGAIAAAPFTGGGSLLGAATLATSLAGAGTIAAAAGTAAVVGGAGAYVARKEDEIDEAKDKKIAEYREKSEKYETGFKKLLAQFQGDKEYFNYIIGATALGIAMANVDGEISQEEVCEIEEFVGGIANSKYPNHVKESVSNLYKNPPNLMTAVKLLEKVNPEHHESIRDLIELVMLADGIEHKKEIAFLQAFEAQILQVEYKPEIDDVESKFLSEIKSNL